jgi:hypothetical protein
MKEVAAEDSAKREGPTFESVWILLLNIPEILFDKQLIADHFHARSTADNVGVGAGEDVADAVEAGDWYPHAAE